MAADVENFPPIVQAIIYVGSAVGITIAAIIGGRKKHREPTDEDTRLAAVERQLADQKTRDSTRRERDQTDKDLIMLRRSIEENLQQVIKALHEPMARQLAEIDRQVVGMKQQINRLSRKQPR